ncbi:hypothetical protein [Streptomyces sp. cg40]|uniref:hypothetical protein n=1 Tax=Streptomyces sp. cg40 TaxID=3419764 RepID=UPI003D038A72
MYLVLSASSVVGLAASGIVPGKVVAVNLGGPATQIHAGTLALGETTLPQPFSQAAGTTAAIHAQAENAAASHFFVAGRSKDESFIHQTDRIVSRG